MKEQAKNCIFGISILLLLTLSIEASLFMTQNSSRILEIYTESLLSIVITSLFLNFGLGILGLFILMNLNDFLQARILNLIGANQRIRILAISLAVNTVSMVTANTIAFFYYPFMKDKFTERVGCMNICVFLCQAATLFSCSLIHPDLSGMKHRRVRSSVKSEGTTFPFLTQQTENVN